MSSKSVVPRSNPTKRSDNPQRQQPVQRQAQVGGSTPNPAEMQKRLGNQGTQAWLAEQQIRTKLTVGQPGDKYEQEADQTAETVMRIPEPAAYNGAPLAKPSLSFSAKQLSHRPLRRQVMKQAEEEDKNKIVQTKELAEKTPEVVPALESRLQAMEGSGQPLPEKTQNFMASKFGNDFSQVRVHANADAVQMNRDLNAQAFTHRQDVFFGAGKYSPESSAGKRLLAHELTHTLQQQPKTKPSGISNVLQHKPKEQSEVKISSITFDGSQVQTIGTPSFTAPAVSGRLPSHPEANGIDYTQPKYQNEPDKGQFLKEPTKSTHQK